MAYYYSNSPSTPFGGPVTRAVKMLIIINVAVFLAQWAGRLSGTREIEYLFGLIPSRVTHEFMIWQFVSYMFLHDTSQFFHIFINLITLYMFGNDLERTWGSKRFLTYYFVTGIGAGLCSYLVGPNANTVTIGASGAIYGLLLAYGLLYPNRLIYLYFLFPVKVKWFVIFIGVVAFLTSISGSDAGVNDIAHLGGILVGLIFLKGGVWIGRYQLYQIRRKREKLKQQFEANYAAMRRKIDDKNNPTIH
jgi:membrane associated rhomboid family serine protease